MKQKLPMNTTHGQSSKKNKTTEYRSWAMMKSRCNSKNNNRYYIYGGRGIKVCERWESFENFFEDMGKKPSRSHSIDRIDNNGNYEPSNCKWSTCEEQANNKSSNRILTFYGTSKTIAQWGKCLNINAQTLQSRLGKGWDARQILTTPVRPWGKSKKRQDGKLTFQEIADRVGCSYATAHSHFTYARSIQFGESIDMVIAKEKNEKLRIKWDKMGKE